MADMRLAVCCWRSVIECVGRRLLYGFPYFFQKYGFLSRILLLFSRDLRNSDSCLLSGTKLFPPLKLSVDCCWDFLLHKESCLQDSPPCIKRILLCRILRLRRVAISDIYLSAAAAILPGRAFYAIGNSNGISYSIKKALILQKDESCQHSLYHLLHCTGLHTQPIHAPCNGGIPLSPTCSFRDKTPE